MHIHMHTHNTTQSSTQQIPKYARTNTRILFILLIPLHTHAVYHRASDPDEVYRVHEMKLQREQLQEEESNLDHLIQMCKHELSLLTENQENWQYPKKLSV